MFCNKFVVLGMLLCISLPVIMSRTTASDTSKDSCYQPEVKGRCRALIVRWRYDPSTGKCKQFNYGGCDGNDNNFLTQKSCQETCEGL